MATANQHDNYTERHGARARTWVRDAGAAIQDGAGRLYQGRGGTHRPTGFGLRTSDFGLSLGPERLIAFLLALALGAGALWWLLGRRRRTWRQRWQETAKDTRESVAAWAAAAQARI